MKSKIISIKIKCGECKTIISVPINSVTPFTRKWNGSAFVGPNKVNFKCSNCEHVEKIPL